MKTQKIFGKKYLELTGCVHVHSKYSYDSTAEPQDIINAALYNKLDYFTITDHLTIDAKNDIDFLNEKRINIIIGSEINDKNEEHHLLVFNSSKVFSDTKAIEYTRFYQKEGAITFAAHPFEKRSTKKIRKYLWTDLENTDFDGIEIWNAVSDWVSKLKPSLNGAFFVFFPSFFIKSANKKAIKWWDELNLQGKRKSAIGSVDAHTFYYDLLGIKIKFLSHKYLFGTIRTNVLIPEKEKINKQDILTALKKGNSYIVNYKVGYPNGFYAGISKRNGDSAIFGEEIDFVEGLKFYYHSPYFVKAKLYRNGEKIAEHTDNKGAFDILEKGNYRLEITKNFKNWIYTNNIYVK